MSSILIKNGLVVNANSTLKNDIMIVDGKIISVENSIELSASIENTIDASDCYVFPGGIDSHVHLDLPTPAGNSSDSFESGSRAAIAGGTTTVLDFVTPARGESLLNALNDRKQIAKKSCIDYGLHMSITWWNDAVAKEMERCVKEEGITSFKTYLAYKGTIGIDYKELEQVMRCAERLNVLVTVHCEEGEMLLKNQKQCISEGKTSPKYHALSRPDDVEYLAVAKVLALAEKTKCAVYIVHVSTAESMRLINVARSKDIKVYAETCPHYLLLNDTEYEREGFAGAAYVMSPPLRSHENTIALWNYVSDGSIDTIATDHCPFNLIGQKDMGISDFTKIPNGVAGIEDRLKLMYTYGVMKNRISLQHFVKITSVNAALIFGFYPQKGLIAKDSDADLVIFNPNTKGVISAAMQYQRCDTNIYEGFKTLGSIAYVIKNGIIVYKSKNGLLLNEAGKYIHRCM